MQRLIIAAVSLSLSLGGLSGGALAQTNSGLVVIDDASGTQRDQPAQRQLRDVRFWQRPAGHLHRSPARSMGSESRDSACRDGAGRHRGGPGSSTTSEAAHAPETTEMAVPTATDQDADNFADALEPEAGLDPTTADTDADYVADGDEFNLYQTDPTIADTDGDGALDGEELFGSHTDPLLWEDGSDTEVTSEPAASSDAATEPGTRIRTGGRDHHAGGDRRAGVADTAAYDKEAAYAEGEFAAPAPPAETTESSSETSTSLLGPDGTYRVTRVLPADHHRLR